MSTNTEDDTEDIQEMGKNAPEDEKRGKTEETPGQAEENQETSATSFDDKDMEDGPLNTVKTAEKTYSIVKEDKITSQEDQPQRKIMKMKKVTFQLQQSTSSRRRVRLQQRN